MTTSTAAIPGHEYLEFLTDPEYWVPGCQGSEGSVYAEGVVLLVDGQRFEQDELTPTTIAPESEVVIVAGDVFQFMLPLHSLSAHFDSWLETNAEHQAPRG
jgi:hypothetical protein